MALLLSGTDKRHTRKYLFLNLLEYYKVQGWIKCYTLAGTLKLLVTSTVIQRHFWNIYKAKAMPTAVSVMQFRSVKGFHLALFHWNSLKGIFFLNSLKNTRIWGQKGHSSVTQADNTKPLIFLFFFVLYLLSHVTHLMWLTVAEFEVIMSQ